MKLVYFLMLPFFAISIPNRRRELSGAQDLETNDFAVNYKNKYRYIIKLINDIQQKNNTDITSNENDKHVDITDSLKMPEIQSLDDVYQTQADALSQRGKGTKKKFIVLLVPTKEIPVVTKYLKKNLKKLKRGAIQKYRYYHTLLNMLRCRLPNTSNSVINCQFLKGPRRSSHRTHRRKKKRRDKKKYSNKMKEVIEIANYEMEQLRHQGKKESRDFVRMKDDVVEEYRDNLKAAIKKQRQQMTDRVIEESIKIDTVMQMFFHKNLSLPLDKTLSSIFVAKDRFGLSKKGITKLLEEYPELGEYIKARLLRLQDGVRDEKDKTDPVLDYFKTLKA